MIQLQNFLRNHSGKNRDNCQGAIDQLTEKLAIKSRRHAKFPNLVLFKYNQIDSPMGNPIVQESRGIILDEANDWAVVSRPYNKFFNIEEGHAAKIDWETAKVLEKLDGSIMSMYNYNGRWQVSTSGTPDACGEVHGFNFTFDELFWKTWNGLGYQYPDPQDENKTFMFELMTPFNRIVVPHKENKLVLHGVRNRDTGEEYPPEAFAYDMFYNWQCVQSYPLANQVEVMNAVNKMNGMECEGFVVVDANFNRVKVKCVEYLAFSRMKEGMGLRDFLDIARKNEQSEMLAYFPEYAVPFGEVKSKYDTLVVECEAFYEEIKGIEDQKAFALRATTKPYSGVLFALRKGSFGNVKEALVDFDLKRLEQMLGIKNVVVSNF